MLFLYLCGTEYKNPITAAPCKEAHYRHPKNSENMTHYHNLLLELQVFPFFENFVSHFIVILVTL